MTPNLFFDIIEKMPLFPEFREKFKGGLECLRRVE
jgi:hypothetical protein